MHTLLDREPIIYKVLKYLIEIGANTRNSLNSLYNLMPIARINPGATKHFIDYMMHNKDSYILDDNSFTMKTMLSKCANFAYGNENSNSEYFIYVSRQGNHSNAMPDYDTLYNEYLSYKRIREERDEEARREQSDREYEAHKRRQKKLGYYSGDSLSHAQNALMASAVAAVF